MYIYVYTCRHIIYMRIIYARFVGYVALLDFSVRDMGGVSPCHLPGFLPSKRSLRSTMRFLPEFCHFEIRNLGFCSKIAEIHRGPSPQNMEYISIDPSTRPHIEIKFHDCLGVPATAVYFGLCYWQSGWRVAIRVYGLFFKLIPARKTCIQLFLEILLDCGGTRWTCRVSGLLTQTALCMTNFWLFMSGAFEQLYNYIDIYILNPETWEYPRKFVP